MPKSNAGKVYNKCTPSPPPPPSPSPAQHLPHNLTTALSVRAAIRKRSEKCCPCFTLTATCLPFLLTLSLPISLCLPLHLLLFFCKCLNNAATFGIYMRIAAAHRRREKKAAEHNMSIDSVRPLRPKLWQLPQIESN